MSIRKFKSKKFKIEGNKRIGSLVELQKGVLDKFIKKN